MSAKQREGEGGGETYGEGSTHLACMVYPPPNPNAAVPQTRSICSPFCLHEKRARVRPAQAGGGSSSVWPGRVRCVGVKAGHQSVMWTLPPSHFFKRDSRAVREGYIARVMGTHGWDHDLQVARPAVGHRAVRIARRQKGQQNGNA